MINLHFVNILCALMENLQLCHLNTLRTCNSASVWCTYRITSISAKNIHRITFGEYSRIVIWDLLNHYIILIWHPGRSVICHLSATLGRQKGQMIPASNASGEFFPALAVNVCIYYCVKDGTAKRRYRRYSAFRCVCAKRRGAREKREREVFGEFARGETPRDFARYLSAEMFRENVLIARCIFTIHTNSASGQLSARIQHSALRELP